MMRINSPLLLVAVSLFAVACGQGKINLVWGDTGDRYAPDATEGIIAKTPFEYPAWRGEKVNAQAFLSSDFPLDGVCLKVSDLKSGASRISSECVKTGFVEYVKADVIDSTVYGQCGFRDAGQFDSIMVADVIDISARKDIPANTVQPIWVSVTAPEDALPGTYSGKLVVRGMNFKTVVLSFEIKLVDRVLPKPSEWTFHLDLWQNPYSIARYHGVDLWSKEHFEYMRPVMEILASAGQKSVTATILDRPWNSQTYDPFGSMVTKIKNADGTWKYDYSVFDRWVEFMDEVGINSQINCYSLIPWSLKFDYINGQTGKTEYMEATPGSIAYRSYWSQFISDFAQHLRDKGWFGKTTIAMDERPLDAMLVVLDIIKSVEPDFKVSLAGNYHAELEKELYDLSIPFGGIYPEDVLARRREEGKISTFYTCCAEAYPNTFLASMPYEATWLVWRVLAHGYDGYLRWSYNSWNDNPLSDTRFRRWPAGDCHLVYPAGRSSVRMEKLIEGIQDYEKAKILREEWTKSSDIEKIAALDSVLSEFTFEDLKENGAENAVRHAKEVISRWP